MAADDEIVVALTANATQLQEGMQQAAASVQGMQAQVAAEAQAFNAAVQSKIDAMTRLNAAFSGNVASNAGMAEAELALDQAMTAGALTAGEYAGFIAQLDAAEAAAVGTVEAATAAIVEQKAAMTITGGVARELGVMIGELARGNYTRLEGSTITLANRTGFLSTALNAVLSPLGLLTVAAAAVGYSIFEAGQNFEHMEGTILATGDASGYTAGQLVGMADRIGESTGSIGNATEAVQKLALSGRFAGQDLQLVAQAASDMSALTGESIQATVAQIEKLQEDPLKAVARLNDQFHFLTVSEYEQMEQLAKSGDTMGAARIAYEAMASSMQSRTDTLNTHVNVLVSNFRKLKTAWNEDMQELDVALGGGDDAERLAIQVRELNILKQKTAEAERMKSDVLPEMTARLQRQTEIVQQMTAKFHDQAQAAANVGAAAQKSAEQIDQMAKKAKHGGSETDAQADKEAFEEMELNRNLSLQQERSYWQEKLSAAKDGTAEYRQALQQLVEIKHKEEEANKEGARKAVEAQKQRNNAVLNGFQIEREETVAASAERIALDARMMDTIEQREGQGSQHFKQALAERMADTKAFVAATVAENKQRSTEEAETYRDAAQEDIGNVQAAFNHIKSINAERVTLGQMTTQQQLAAERDLAERQYQIDQSILERWSATFADRPRIVEQVNKQIDALNQQHQARMDQLDQKATKDSVDTWNKRLAPITRGFNQSISGMIMGTQTLKQGMDRMFQSILLSEIQTDAERLQHWVATEIAKVGATAAGAEATKTIQATAAAETKALDAENARGEVTNAAAAAGAKAYQAVVGIPIVGPILAPIAAGVAFAGVEAFGGNISSAAGGWDRVPADDAPALLHRNEMVLPATLADRVRGMTDSGNGGGTTQHINVHANDAHSFSQMLTRDPHAFAKAAKRAAYVKGGRR